MVIKILSHVHLIHILEYKILFQKNTKDNSFTGKPQLLGDVFIFAKDEILPKEFCVYGSHKNNLKAHGAFIITQNDEFLKIDETYKKSKFVIRQNKIKTDY